VSVNPERWNSTIASTAASYSDFAVPPTFLLLPRARRTKPLRRYLHGPNVSLRRLNYVRAPTARDVVILEGGGCRAVQSAHAIRFGDLIRFGGATVGVGKHVLILRCVLRRSNGLPYGLCRLTVLDLKPASGRVLSSPFGLPILHLIARSHRVGKRARHRVQ
jgi:hypothetical protein